MNDNVAQRAMFLAGEMMGDTAKCGLTPICTSDKKGIERNVFGGE